MMMRRSSSSGGESLELLLDTICNVFGGIVLMAIMVVLQTQAAAGRLSSADFVYEGAPGRDERQLARQIEDLQETVDELQQQKTAMVDTARQICSPATVELMEAHEKFSHGLSEANHQLKETLARLQQLRQEVNKTRQEASRKQDQVLEARQQIKELQQRLQMVMTTSSKGIRLPHRQGAATGEPRYLIVQGDQVYGFGHGGLPLWVGAPYDVEDCTVSPTNTEKLAATATPRPGAAKIVPPADHEPTEFMNMMTAYPAQKYYVVLYVAGDSKSFASFQRLKEILLSRGYGYVVGPPIPQGQALIVSPTTHHRTE